MQPKLIDRNNSNKHLPVSHMCGVYYPFDIKPLLNQTGDALSNTSGQNYSWHSPLLQRFSDLLSKICSTFNISSTKNWYKMDFFTDLRRLTLVFIAHSTCSIIQLIYTSYEFFFTLFIKLNTINKIQIKTFIFFKEIIIFLTMFPLWGRGVLPLHFYDVMINTLRPTRFAYLPRVLVVWNWSRFSTGNSGKSAHPRGTASHLGHTVAVLWNQSQVKTIPCF